MKKAIVFRLKELVSKHNISLRELARLSDIEPSKISKLSNNKQERIYIPDLVRIAEVLNISDINGSVMYTIK